MMDPQRQSTKSRTVDAQLPLLSGMAPSNQPEIPYLLGLPTLRRVVRYAMSLADLEPKQVYGPLGKDKATWSRIESGDMSFHADDLVNFTQVVGNDAVLLWLAHQCGYDVVTMRKRQDDKDKRIAELEELLTKQRAENEVIARFFRETMR